MLVVFPFCARDKSLAIKLAEWIEELGGVKSHDCVLTAARGVSSDGILEPLQRAFKSVKVNVPYDDREGWPFGANLLWQRSVEFVAIGEKGLFKKSPESFFWIEPDAVPLKSTWLDEIEVEYRKSITLKKAFMGMYVQIEQASPHLSGIAVYPPNIVDFTERFLELNNEAFDSFFGKDFLKHSHFTKLIQHVYWKSHKPDLSPTFPDKESLSYLTPEAVIFHRSKDGTLIDRLRESKGNPYKQEVKEEPVIKQRPKIYSYYEEVPGIDSSDANKLIHLWKVEWDKIGFDPVIMDEDDAREHPLYGKFDKIIRSFPSQNPAGYDRACWMRWLAFSSKGAGWMSDYDVFPLANVSATTDAGVSFFSGNQNDPNIPCLVKASKEGIDSVLAHFQSHKPDSKHTSDMIALRTFQASNNGTVKEFGEDNWHLGMAVHFSNSRMQNHQPRWKHVPNLLKASDKLQAFSIETIVSPEVYIKQLSITQQIKFLCDDLQKLTDGKQGRQKVALDYLREIKLVPRARSRK